MSSFFPVSEILWNLFMVAERFFMIFRMGLAVFGKICLIQFFSFLFLGECLSFAP